jgi:hypothetical protein
MSKERDLIYKAIEEERLKQDKQWGGSNHDDEHTISDWYQFINTQMLKLMSVRVDKRLALIKIAALALAAIESWDRKQAEWNRRQNRG